MRGMHAAICSIAVLLILLQADVTLSRSGRGRSRSSSRSSSRYRPSSGSSSSYTRWETGSHNTSGTSIDNAGQSVHKADTYLDYSASTPEDNTVRYQNYPVHHNIPSYNPSFPFSYQGYPETAPDPRDDLDYITKLLKQLQGPDHPESFGYPSYGGDGRRGQYHSSPWESKTSEPTLKLTAGRAGPGSTTGHFLPGCSMFAMRFHFDYVREDDWWYKNCHRYPHRVTFPRYGGPVREEVFVRDCWNATMNEFVAPGEKEQADEMEAKVLSQVVRQMCLREYQARPQPSGEDSFWGTHRMKPVPDATFAEAEGEAAVLSAPASAGTHSHLDDLLLAILPMLLIAVLHI